MTWVDWTLGVVSVIAIIIAYAATERSREYRTKLRNSDAKLLAASWLANYHARFTWGLQDYVASRENISYGEVCRRARQQLLMAGRSHASLFIPMDVVPESLRSAAMLYNSDVWSRWPTVFSGPVTTDETDDQRQRRLLESGVQMISSNYRRYARRVSELTKEDYDVVEGIMETLDKFVRDDVDRLFGLGLPDPEEILPGRY